MFDTKGFDKKTIEKIYRICDILQRLYSIQFTKNHLALYGGTCLNFLHFKEIPRLSLDIDFNYREHETEDWEKDRNEIDKIIKKVLSDLHYTQSGIKIQASYPLTRFMVHYKTKNGERDSLKIEIGYVRRIPILKHDIFLSFLHLETEEEFSVKTTMSEELFGNKFCTLLYRYKEEGVISSRDIFDVYMISKMEFNEKLFESATVVDSLMREEPRLYKHDVNQVIIGVKIDDQLKKLLRNRQVPNDLKQRTHIFVDRLLSHSKEKHKDIIDTFFDKHRFEPTLLNNYKMLNPHIGKHPGILWNMRQLRQQKTKI